MLAYRWEQLLAQLKGNMWEDRKDFSTVTALAAGWADMWVALRVDYLVGRSVGSMAAWMVA